MRALIDADRYPYAFGNSRGEDDQPLPWPLLAARVDDHINKILERVSATSYQLYLTSDDRSNFRYSIATIQPYKGNRPSDKSFWYEQLRRYLIDRWGAQVVHGMEADDAIGIQQDSGSIIVSVDKDLNNIPGLHYNELEDKIYEVSEIDSLRNFYKQCLIGDRVDNILGLYGVGTSSALLQHIDRYDEELGMYLHVKEQYTKRFGTYWKMFLWETAALLWIKRGLELSGEKEIHTRLESLERSSEAL